MSLPEGYRVDRDPDVWTLLAPDGSVVARFIAGAPDSEIEQAAQEHQRGRDFREIAVAVVVGLIVGVVLGWGYGLESALW